MTLRNYSSIAQQTTLNGGINSSVASLVVVSATNLMGGVTPSSSTYTVVIDPDTALEEILDVTAIAGNTLTVVRGIDGSTAQAHSSGAVIRHMLIGRDPREASAHSENVTTAHGITLSTLVKTTDKLSVHAATTSAELAGVISDETGTGALVFGTGATLTNPKIGGTYTAKTASYTFASGDEGNIFSMNNAATQQFNIPTDATFNFAVKTELSGFWIAGAGQPTIGAVTPGTTTVVSTGATSATPKLRAVTSGFTAVKIAANSWIVFGDLA